MNRGFLGFCSLRPLKEESILTLHRDWTNSVYSSIVCLIVSHWAFSSLKKLLNFLINSSEGEALSGSTTSSVLSRECMKVSFIGRSWISSESGICDASCCTGRELPKTSDEWVELSLDPIICWEELVSEFCEAVAGVQDLEGTLDDAFLLFPSFLL